MMEASLSSEALVTMQKIPQCNVPDHIAVLRQLRNWMCNVDYFPSGKTARARDSMLKSI